jgi:hypothetical protein
VRLNVAVIKGIAILSILVILLYSRGGADRRLYVGNGIGYKAVCRQWSVAVWLCRFVVVSLCFFDDQRDLVDGSDNEG